MSGSKLFACAALVAGLFAGGCTIFIKGDTVQEYKSGRDPVMIEATQDGEYALYSIYETTPRGTFRLKEGDPIGFKPSKTGRVIAVAGSREMEVADGSYVWKRKPPAVEEKAVVSKDDEKPQSTQATPNKN